MAAWYTQGIITKIVKEIAEEVDLTPSEVLGVISFYFEAFLKGSKGMKVKLFKVLHFGSFTAKGYIPRRVNPKNKKRFNRIEVQANGTEVSNHSQSL